MQLTVATCSNIKAVASTDNLLCSPQTKNINIPSQFYNTEDIYPHWQILIGCGLISIFGTLVRT